MFRRLILRIPDINQGWDTYLGVSGRVIIDLTSDEVGTCAGGTYWGQGFTRYGQ